MKLIHLASILAGFAVLLSLACTKESSANYGPPQPTGQGGSLARYAVVGSFLYIVDGENLKTYDLADPSSPVLSSEQAVGFEIETIYPLKDKLFIGSTSVVYIFSLTDPARPEQLSVAVSPNVLRRCDPVVAKDSVAFATLRSSGPCGGFQSILSVIDIRNINDPVEVQAIPMTEPYGLAYADSALYVADGVSGINVFDIRDAFLPRLLNSLQIDDDKPIDMISYRDELIVWSEKGLVIYDIHDRFNPVLLSKII